MSLSDSILWTKSKRLCHNAITFIFLQTHKLGDSHPRAWNKSTTYFERFPRLCCSDQSSTIPDYNAQDESLLLNNPRCTISLLLKAKMPFVAGGDACRINPSSPTIDYYSFVTLEKAWSYRSNLTLNSRTTLTDWAINHNSVMGCTSCRTTLPTVFHSRIHSTWWGREEPKSAFNLPSTP